MKYKYLFSRNIYILSLFLQPRNIYTFLILQYTMHYNHSTVISPIEKRRRRRKKGRKEQQSKIHRKRENKIPLSSSRFIRLIDITDFFALLPYAYTAEEKARSPIPINKPGDLLFLSPPAPPRLFLSPSSSLPPLPRPPAVNINWTARLTKRVVANSRGLSVPSRLAQWLMDKSRRVMLISAQSLRQNACAPLMNIHRAI